jgi:parallel beta-helix repeat protein
MLEDSNRYNLVTDNYCNDNDKDGIMLFQSDNNIVSDNYLYHNGYCGIWVRDESDGNTILGNIAANNGWNLGGPCAADAPWSGIRVGTNCDNNQINSNRCFDFDNQATKTGTKTQMWGISITDSASENNMVHDNYVLGNGIGGITDNGTGSDIKDNKERQNHKDAGCRWVRRLFSHSQT